MSDKFKISKEQDPYFVIFTITDWIKVLADDSFYNKDGNYAELLYGNRFIQEKLKYIHSNPVKYGLCDEEWDYKFSSATNYTDKQSLIEVILLV